ncbi:hypothetical protein [Roseateles amylovorans]|uniref:Uncharacterized protein n=1 Tax=Roseateles amylovorans TaxID=2978473 RepID=A0ABY6B3J7_9BURK|nr:hypothetical protein [Roseateles amylovorans]UXH79963.1 hypothetical protein N4261_08820 [Roseateles amylovorans]
MLNVHSANAASFAATPATPAAAGAVPSARSCHAPASPAHPGPAHPGPAHPGPAHSGSAEPLGDTPRPTEAARSSELGDGGDGGELGKDCINGLGSTAGAGGTGCPGCLAPNRTTDSGSPAQTPPTAPAANGASPFPFPDPMPPIHSPAYVALWETYCAFYGMSPDESQPDPAALAFDRFMAQTRRERDHALHA